MSVDRVQHGQGEYGNTAGAAEDIKYAEETDELKEWGPQVQLLEIDHNQGSHIT